MIRLALYILIILFFNSCARISNPTGGAKDTIAPKIIKTFPEIYSKNIKLDLKEINIFFDEFITLQDVQQQLVISPPMNSFPIFFPNGNPSKEIKIKFNEKLKENTTYSINFGESIKDNNEGNKLSDFQYVFSTSNEIDSLKITGKISNFIDSKINKNTIIALYKTDSLDFRKKPYYITKINEKTSDYKLNYIKEGTYKIIAFTDENSNKIFDSEKEEIAFINDSININQHKEIDLKLSRNKSNYKLVSNKQEESGKIKFIFKGNPELIDIIPQEQNIKNYIIQHKSKTDSAYFWFDPKQINNDKDKNINLKFLVKNKDKIDTANVSYNLKSKQTKLEIINQSKNLVPKKKLFLEFNNPIKTINQDKIEVFNKDKKLEIATKISTENIRSLEIDFPINLENEYKINLLPNSIEDIFKNTIDSLDFEYKTKSEKDFGNLKLVLKNKPETKFFLQLLDEKNKVLEEIYSNKDTFDFMYLNPGSYSFRILIDENENNFYDLADFEHKIQAEKTYLYPKKILVRSFWDISETWELK